LRDHGCPRDRDHGDIEAFAPSMQEVSSGPRFASIKIDSTNLERVLSSAMELHRARIRGALGRLCGLSVMALPEILASVTYSCHAPSAVIGCCPGSGDIRDPAEKRQRLH